MKKFSIVRWVAEVGFVSLLGACSSESVIANSVDSVNSSSSEAIISSSSEVPPSSSSEQEPFNPSDYRTCDEKYEGKFLMYQYTKVLDVMGTSFIIATDFYKCESGKWSEPITNANPWMEKIGGDAIDRNVIDGDVVRVAPDEWVCSAENEGLVQSWSYMYAANHAPGRTPTYYARCEQGDWVLCEPESSSSSSEKSSSSVVESSSSVEESSSSEVTPESSFSATSVSSSSADVQSSSSEIESSSSSSEDKVDCSALLEGETGWSWDVPKECRFNPDIDYGSMTDERDGKTYKTVKIGDQTWMAENLNYYDASDLNVKEKSWCFGKKDNGDSSTCDVAGRLYTWAAAIDSVKLATDTKNPQDCGDGKKCALPDTVYGICPPGWHLPSKAEFGTLLTVMGGQSTASNVLKSQSGWAESKNGADAFGFTALPVGGWAPLYGFYLAGNGAYFWSATGFDADYAEHLGIDYDKEKTFLDFAYKHGGSSVRCIKNK